MRKVIILTAVLLLAGCMKSPSEYEPTQEDLERACNVYHAITRNQPLNQAYFQMCVSNTSKRQQTVTDNEADIARACNTAAQAVYPTTVDSFLGKNGEAYSFLNALKRAQIACIEKE